MTPGLIQDAQRRLAGAITAARSIPFDSFESASAEELQEKLLPQTAAALRSANETVLFVENLTEDRRAFQTFQPPPSPRLLRDLGDLCYIVQSEIAARLKTLSLPRKDTPGWAVLVAAERSSFEVARGLCAIEQELSGIFGIESQTSHVDFLRDALMSRRATTKFRRAVLHKVADDVIKLVRSAGTALARMIGRDEFRKLRISDRITARRLHSRVVDFLRETEPEVEDGRRLVEDIRNFAVLLDELNQREELLAHDAGILKQSIGALASLDPHVAPPGAELDRLHHIFGRDDLLDRLLTSGGDVAAILSRLLVLQRKLGDRGSDPASEPELSEVADLASTLQRS